MCSRVLSCGVLELGVLQFCWPLMYAVATSLCVQLLCIQAARLSPLHHIHTPRPQQRTDRDRATALNTAHPNTPPGRRTVLRNRRPDMGRGRRTVLRNRRPDMGRDTIDCDASEASCAQERFSNHRIVRRLSIRVNSRENKTDVSRYNERGTLNSSVDAIPR